jgi:hypothetical protein
MSSNRLIYDKCAYATEIKESTEPLEYNLFLGKFENCKTCAVGDHTNVLPFGPRADTESELWGLPRLNSKCPSEKYVANSQYDNPALSAAKMCESIYYITPNNLEKPTSNMLNENNLGVNFCPVEKKEVAEQVEQIEEPFLAVSRETKLERILRTKNPINMSAEEISELHKGLSASDKKALLQKLTPQQVAIIKQITYKL